MSGRTITGNDRKRVLRSVVLKQVQGRLGVCNTTARLWLRTNGPKPCTTISQKATYFWQDETEAWLARIAP